MTFAAVALVASALGYVSIRTTIDDITTVKKVQKCSELAPGVKYCADVGSASVDVVLDVNVTSYPAACEIKVAKKETNPQLLMHYTGDASVQRQPPHAWTRFVAVEDFTHASAVKLGAGETVSGFDMALEGLCEGSTAVVIVPPELGFDEPGAKAPPRPAAVPVGATLRYELEVIKVLKVAEDGVPYRPCFFSLIDTDDSGDLDEAELAAHFARIGQQMPTHVMSEDTDGDGRIGFDEFTGPKIPREARDGMRREQVEEAAAAADGDGGGAGAKDEL